MNFIGEFRSLGFYYGCMPYRFPEEMFATVLGGLSILDVPRLHVHSQEEAKDFIKTYGYDLKNDKDLAEVLRLYRMTVDFFDQDLLVQKERIPKDFLEVKRAEDFYNLLIQASSTTMTESQMWACALLRVLHVLNHLRNGLFRTFSETIQDQIFGLFYGHIKRQQDNLPYLGDMKSGETIRLYEFDVKKYKTKSSSAIKLLAKKNEYAMNILDRMGVRFVTYSMFDSFRVLKYLITNHLISVPNVVPDQSKNTLFPLNVFLDVMDKLNLQKRTHTEEEIDAILWKTLEKWGESERQYIVKPNDFSAGDYRAIKFIARHMINIPIGKKNLRFFFPYEIQIVDHKTHILNTTGESSHNEYKARQRQAAKERVFGELLKSVDN